MFARSESPSLLAAGAACPALVLLYVDPGAGSMLIQVLLGGVAGLVVFGNLLKHRIRRLFRRGQDDEQDTGEK